MITFRDLTAEDVEVRIGSVKQSGFSLLLYKNARCDMALLDESVGPMNWQRHHSRDNANCIVSIKNPDTGEWIEKEDVGTESNTEKDKGLASDSFKRACFNWGLGRELYTAPFIWINADKGTKNDRFRVMQMTVENKRITSLEIVNTSREGWPVVFRFGKTHGTPQRTAPARQTASEKPQETTEKPQATPQADDMDAALRWWNETMNATQRAQWETYWRDHYSVVRVKNTDIQQMYRFCEEKKKGAGK